MEHTHTKSRNIEFDVYRLESRPTQTPRLKLLRANEEVLVDIEGTSKWRPVPQKTLEVLEYLNDHAREVCTYDAIIAGVWGTDAADPLSNNAVEKHISLLVKHAFLGERLILNHPKKGYELRCQSEITEVPSRSSLPSPIGSEPRKHMGKAFACRFFESDEDAALYLADRYASPELKTVLNTYVRLKPHPATWRKTTVDLMVKNLAAFAKRSVEENGNTVCFFHVVGGYPEAYYHRRLVALARRRRSQLSFRWLLHCVPMMNFTILEYKDKTQDEVLFGWGRHVECSPEAVVQSNNQGLVEEYRSLYALLRRDDVSEAKESAEIRLRLGRLRSSVEIDPRPEVRHHQRRLRRG
jgi:DNA-binding winged helix-turn-helix (wHTH) protein